MRDKCHKNLSIQHGENQGSWKVAYSQMCDLTLSNGVYGHSLKALGVGTGEAIVIGACESVVTLSDQYRKSL